MSVIFSFALTGLGYIAHAVWSVAENLHSSSSEFELSQDGETVWDECSEYSFVGFGENGDFSTALGAVRVSVGKKLGKLRDEPDYKVWQLRAAGGDYIMLKNHTDTSEVFKRIR